MSPHPRTRRIRRIAWVLAVLGSSLVAGAPPSVLASGTQVTTGVDAPVSDRSQDGTPPNCNVQSEVSLAASGDVVVAGWNDMAGRCVEARLQLAGASTVGFGSSSDRGATWTDGGLLAPMRQGGTQGTLIGDPTLAAGPDGTFYYASIGRLSDDPLFPRSVIAVARSSDGGASWSEPVDAGPRYRSAPTDQLYQDKPWIAADTTASLHRGNVYVVWTEWRNGVGSLVFSRSTDGGRTFEARAIADRVTASAQVAVGADGEVYLAWVEPNLVARFVRSMDGGKTFGAATVVAALKRVGRPSEACVSTIGGETTFALNGDVRVASFPSLAVDLSGSSDPEDADFNPHRGRIYFVVASDPDPNFNPGDADIAFLYSSDRGSTWVGVQDHPRRFIDDDPSRNDQWHPQVAVDDRGTVAVTWYDRRLSPSNMDIDVFGAVSTDGGETFSPNFRVTDRSFPTAVNNPHPGLMSPCYMGDYNGLVAVGQGRFVAAWGDNRNATVATSAPDPRLTLPDPDVYRDVITVAAPSV